MRGELIAVWAATWREIWTRLEAHEDVGEDLFCEIYPLFVKALKTESAPSPTELLTITNDRTLCRRRFRRTQASDLSGERHIVEFLEAAHDALDELWGATVADYYYGLLFSFVEKYSLRYDLRRPFALCPTLPGVFASLLRDLRVVARRDSHLDRLMKDFDAAVRDLRHDCSDTRIKTCIQKQMNLAEALGRAFPGVKQSTLGSICDELRTWPHQKMRDALKNLYGFASDYPGIRHGGTPANALRDIDMRDMVAMSILLAGFTPYLTQLDPTLFTGGREP